MDDLMQALFDHITDHLLEKYYGQTAYVERCEARDEIGRSLWEQLPPPSRRTNWKPSSGPMITPRWRNWKPCFWPPSTS